MKKLTIVADDKIPFLQGVFEPHGVDVHYKAGGLIAPADLKDAHAIITRTRTHCNRALLENSQVKYIATATIGYDHLDVEYLNSQKIKWSNAVGCNSGSVMQYIVASLLHIERVSGEKLSTKTLGVIGVGNVGRKVVKAAKALGMKVLQNDPPRADIEGDRDFVSLDRVLSDSDIITIHTPLNRGGEYNTYHLVDELFLSSMRPTSWLINSARGEITSTTALKTALKGGIIAGAILDVWENEPQIDLELLSSVALGTSHIAGYSTDGKANGTQQSVRAIAEYFNIAGLKDFKCTALPEVSNASIDLADLTLFELIQNSYNIYADYIKLHSCPEGFEEHRGSYPVRREFGAFTVYNGTKEQQDMAKKLGFLVKN